MTTNNSNNKPMEVCDCLEQGEYITGLTKTGKTWVPNFIDSLNQENCAGCGRCYKACLFGVFDLIDRPDSDYVGGAKVMSIARPENCIGDRSERAHV